MVTLQDVAREAGVAVSTASRALTHPERISPPTRARVQEVARRLGYRPNRIARAVVSGRTQMLAVLVPDITNPHRLGLIRGAEERARAADRTLVLGDTRGDPGLEADHLDRLGSVVDGIVLASSRLPDADLRELARRRPVVLHDRELAGLPGVVTDFDDGMRQILGHLVGLGHRRVAYLSGSRRSWSEGRRWAALAAEATRTGVGVACLGPFPPMLDGGPAAADAGLASGATALVASNDLLAIGVLRRLEERGVPVPQTVSVTGFDDIFGADFCHPPLTTVTAPTEEAGRVLVDVLLGGHAQDAERTVLPVRLRVRGSTGPAR
ncbi:MAG: LacI family DNA-binding transcriptional regulator [Pseudonocardia sp.]|nr:LacI family DNA-binding transcriptional regulator [Pseudonocardia sp.]